MNGCPSGMQHAVASPERREHLASPGRFMPTPSATLHTGAFSVREMLLDTWSMITNHVTAFAALTLAGATLSWLCDQCVGLIFDADSRHYFMATSLLTLPVFSWIWGAWSYWVCETAITDARPDPAAAHRWSMQQLTHVMWIRLIASVRMGLATLALVLPGLWVTTTLYLSEPAATLGHVRPLNVSKAATRERMSSVFAAIFIVTMVDFSLLLLLGLAMFAVDTASITLLGAELPSALYDPWFSLWGAGHAMVSGSLALAIFLRALRVDHPDRGLDELVGWRHPRRVVSYVPATG